MLCFPFGSTAAHKSATARRVSRTLPAAAQTRHGPEVMHPVAGRMTSITDQSQFRPGLLTFSNGMMSKLPTIWPLSML